jgi:hypothetical protein
MKKVRQMGRIENPNEKDERRNSVASHSFQISIGFQEKLLNRKKERNMKSLFVLTPSFDSFKLLSVGLKVMPSNEDIIESMKIQNGNYSILLKERE